MKNWNDKLKKGSRYRFRVSKYHALLAEVGGEWTTIEVFGTPAAANTQAWRIRQGFYGKGFDARVHDKFQLQARRLPGFYLTTQRGLT